MKSGGFTAVVRWPQPWPPDKEGILLNSADDQTTSLVVAKTDGSLAILVKAEDGIIRLCEFQKILIGCSGTIILTAIWDETSASIRINGTELLRGTPAHLPCFIIKTHGGAVAEATLLFPGLTRDAARNEAEALFLGTILELDRTILERDWYTAMRAGNSIRQLLTDGFLDRVNQSYKLKFRFVASGIQPLVQDWLNQKAELAWFNCDPAKAPGGKIAEYDLPHFLNYKVLCCLGSYATVKDVIRACANSKGGVHFKSPKAGPEEAVLSLDEIVKATGLPLSLDGLLGICNVTLKAVRPLVEAIMK